MKLSKRQLKRLIREEKKKLNEGQMGELWYGCMDTLFQMALDNGYVCCLCAASAIEQSGQASPTMDVCCQLIQDCCDDGMLTPIKHPKHFNVVVYTAID